MSHPLANVFANIHLSSSFLFTIVSDRPGNDPGCQAEHCLPMTLHPINSCQNKPVRVLVLEETPRSAPVIDALTRAEFEFIHARHAHEAWATLEAGEDVDVLLADIDLPGATFGVELGRYIHARWPGLGLVLTSDRVRHLRPEEVPGDACFLPRPIPADTLLEEIRLAVRRP
jgi:CheY-like chemotaxis protein